MKIIKKISIFGLTIILMLICLAGNTKASTANTQLPENEITEENHINNEKTEENHINIETKENIEQESKKINEKQLSSQTKNKPEVDLENCTVIDIVINSNKNSKENLNENSNEKLIQKSNENPNKNPNKSINTTIEIPKIEKNELELCKLQLANLKQTDYEEASWNNLQNSILKAEKVETVEEYNNIKEELCVDNLVPVNFEKAELNYLIEELAEKSKRDYTKKSWEQLQGIILDAENAKVESEYNSIKTKLTTDILKEKVPNERHIKILPLIMLGVVIVIMVAIILYGREKGVKNNRKAKNKSQLEPISVSY